MKIEIGGRAFEFTRPTIVFLKKYQVARLEEFFSGVDFMKIATQDEAYADFVKNWKKFCDVAFEKSLAWKFGFRPKELHPEKIPLDEISRVVKSFFAYVGGGMK